MAVLALGLFVLVACRRSVLDEPDVALQVEKGPVAVSLMLSVKDYGEEGNTITKGVFVDNAVHYAHEKAVDLSTIVLLAFDAENAFENDGSDKLVFKPENATLIGTDRMEILHAEAAGAGRVRADFILDKPYPSLALIALANYPSSSFSISGTDMKAVAQALASVSVDYVPGQDQYHSGGIPMHGYKVFGTLEGLPVSDTDAQENSRLKYYKGMSTPLTAKGFRTQAELEKYAKPGTGTGTVGADDCLPMTYALARLQLRYLPAAGQVPASLVDITVALNGYKAKYRMVPAGWLDGNLTPFDAVGDIGDYVTGSISFKEVTYNTSDKAYVAYVPEMGKASMALAVPEPGLSVTIKKYEADALGERTSVWTSYTYSGGTVTVAYSDPSKPAVTYANGAWTAWLRMRTVYARKDKNDNDVPVGSLFSLVRHYSYEWEATGIDK